MDREHYANLTAEAEQRIRPFIHLTPLLPSRFLSDLVGGEVFLKMESEQLSGSFKLRGATNKVLLTQGEQQQQQQLVTASTGNHAIATATALARLGLRGTIVLPETVVPEKKETLRLFRNVDLVFHGTDCIEAEARARQLAQETGGIYVSPYNDVDIMTGQGTIAVEILSQAPAVDAVFVTVGGGGLAGGVAAYIKSRRPGCQVIGCQPVNSAVMHESVKAGKILDLESLDTLSDGSAGGIEEGSVTFEVCRTCIDEFVLVTEDEIKAAMLLMLDRHHKLVEGAAAVAVASLIKEKARFVGKTVAIIICGGNVGRKTLLKILA